MYSKRKICKMVTEIQKAHFFKEATKSGQNQDLRALLILKTAFLIYFL